MKRKISSLFLGVLVFVFFILSGCAGDDRGETKRENSENQQTASAMGRYIEEKIDLPVSVTTLFDLRDGEDGQMRMLFEDEPGSLYLYGSSDEGAKWNEQKLKTDWLPENYRVAAACVDGNGNIFVCAGEMAKDPMARKTAVGIYHYYRIDKTGNAKEVSLELPAAKGEYLLMGYGLMQSALADDGKLYGILYKASGEGSSPDKVYCFDSESGKKIWSANMGNVDLALFDNQLYAYIYEKDMLKHIDTENGKELEETECPYDITNIDIKPEKNRVYYCDATGIYGTDSEMGIRELLVDGALSSFSRIGYDTGNLFCVKEDVFLLMLGSISGDWELYRYKYDPSVPTRPDNELTVYALKENPDIDTLVSDFQEKHPEVYVRYEVGMQSDSIKNESDAINALNTEIAAGNGPDVLVLNNLPWESYMEKGILADLGSCYEKEEVYENLFLPFEREGITRAVPVAFKIPMAGGEKSTVSNIHSAEELLEEVKATEETVLPLCISEEKLIRFMSSVYWQNVQTEDGSLSRENLSRLLETVKQIQDCIKSSKSEYANSFFWEEDENMDSFYEYFDASFASSDIFAMGLAYLDGADSLAYLYNYNSSWQALSEGTFSPLLVGISQKSERMDIAEEFVRFSLSEEEQKSFDSPDNRVFFSGFPVNKKALKNMEKKPSKSDLEKRRLQWPPEEAFLELEEQIQKLKTPAMEDNIVMNTIEDSAKPYLAGEKSLDTAVNEIMQTLELYFAE